MIQHTLQGRSEAEVTWFQRREAIAAAGAWLALGGWGTAQAQQRGNVVEFVGDILLNGQRMLPQQVVQTGAEIHTGAASRLIFVIGNASFHVRQNSRLRVERDRRIDGRFRLGLVPGVLARIPGAETIVFQPGERGLLWTTLRVTGTIDDPEEDLTGRLLWP